MSANCEADVINRLSADSLFPISVTDGAASTKKSLEMSFEFGGKPNGQKMAVFYQQLASLLENGVPLIRSLTLLQQQTKNKKLEAALADVIARVEDGEELADCFVAMIQFSATWRSVSYTHLTLPTTPYV